MQQKRTTGGHLIRLDTLYMYMAWFYFLTACAKQQLKLYLPITQCPLFPIPFPSLLWKPLPTSKRTDFPLCRESSNFPVCLAATALPLQPVRCVICQVWPGGGTLPLAGDGDGTLPLQSQGSSPPWNRFGMTPAVAVW